MSVNSFFWRGGGVGRTSVGRLLRSDGGGWVRRCCLSRIDAAAFAACLRRRCPVRCFVWERNELGEEENLVGDSSVLVVLMSPC